MTRTARAQRLAALFAAVALMQGCADIRPATQGTVGFAPSPAPATATATTTTTATTPTPPEPASAPEYGRMVNVMPLSSAKDSWGAFTEAGAAFSGTYTRLVISSKLASQAAAKASSGDAGPVPVLPYQQRLWLSRALVGKDFSVALTAKLKVADVLSLTVPLAVIGHQSNSEGEVWIRDLQLERSDFPLFLVKSDGTGSVPNLTIELKGSNTFSSRGAAAGVSALARVVKLAGAEPAVITRLTKSTTESAAAEIDSAISRLLSSSVTERYGDDRDLRRWTSKSPTAPEGLELTFQVPKDEGDWGSPPLVVGTWTLTFAPPRPSVFSDWSICTDDTKLRCSADLPAAQAKVRQEVRASEILNYRLLHNAPEIGTIRAFLLQQEWFTTAVTAFAKNRQDYDAASLFCQRVVNEIVGLGLNDFDGKLVLRAVSTGMPILFPDLAKAPACKSVLDELNASPPTPTR
jgi:hypothetical protein